MCPEDIQQDRHGDPPSERRWHVDPQDPSNSAGLGPRSGQFLRKMMCCINLDGGANLDGAAASTIDVSPR